MSSPTTCNGKHIGSKHSLPLNITIAGNPSRSATLIPAVSFLLNYITDCCLHFTRTLIKILLRIQLITLRDKIFQTRKIFHKNGVVDTSVHAQETRVERGQIHKPPVSSSEPLKIINQENLFLSS